MSQTPLSERFSEGRQTKDDHNDAAAYFDLSSMALNGLSSRPNSFINKAPGYESVEAYDIGEQTPTDRRASQLSRKPLPLNSRVYSQESFTAALLDEQQRQQERNGYGGGGYEGARVSQWGIGWKTPAIMVALYLMAFMTALTHLLVLRYLDGRRSDGTGSIPQQYVTVASILLSNVFRAALVLSLSMAFTQYLWYMMRNSSMKVSTIELLYGIRGNFLLLLYPAVISAAPVLFLLAGLGWMVQIAAIYPPGALTIVPSPFEGRSPVTVPGFNATTMDDDFGGGSRKTAVVQLAVVTSESSSYFYNFPVPSLSRASRQVLSAGEISRGSSPCGANCSYVTRFEGPYMKCTEPKTANISMAFTNETHFANQEGINYLYSGQMGGNISDVTSNYSTASFDFYTSRIVGFWPAWANVSAPHSEQPDADTNYIWESTNMSCVPWRAKYTVNTTWEEGTRKLQYTAEPVSQLTNIRNTPMIGEANHDSWTRDVNYMALFESLVVALSGNYSSLVSPSVGSHYASNDTYTLDNGTVVGMDPAMVTFNGDHWNDPSRQFGANETIIGDTRFNLNSAVFVPANNSALASAFVNSSAPKIYLTQDSLNDALFNITMSVSVSTHLWPMQTSALLVQYYNTYSFSHPNVLLLPYGLSLLVAIPFLMTGAWALWKNGVPAQDGGIIQLLSTTTGSRSLERTAAAGCLGGEGNVPRELSEMRIRFGEVVSSGLEAKGGGIVRRAGFGIDEEIVPLKRSNVYGYS